MRKLTKALFDELKRNAIDSSNECQCPIWKVEGAWVAQYHLDGTGRGRCYSSHRAGGFFILLCPVDEELAGEDTRKRISSWIWEWNAAVETLGMEDEAELPELTPDDIREIAKRPSLIIDQRIDRALRAIGRPPAWLPGPVWESAEFQAERDVQKLFQAATECGADAAEMDWLLKEMESAELTKNISQVRFQPGYTPTVKGLHRLETGGEALVSKTAFVAMWFDDEVSDAYNLGMDPAIREAGYEPVRIDRKHHVGKIDDEIVAEIRRSRFLVCDLTSSLLDDPGSESGKTPVARGGVYYEAGFAHGLGKTVIWTCRGRCCQSCSFRPETVQLHPVGSREGG